MVDPIGKTLDYFYAIQSDSIDAKLLSLLPLINNLFFQIKKEHIYETDQRELKRFGWVLRAGLFVQIFLYAKPLSMYLERISFKRRTRAIFNISIYVIFSDMHIKTLTPD